jgi:hypothetical protein
MSYACASWRRYAQRRLEAALRDPAGLPCYVSSFADAFLRSEVVRVHVSQKVEQRVTWLEVSVVEADEGGQDEAGTAECSEHSELSLEGERSLATRGGKEAEKENAQHGDLAEGGFQWAGIEKLALLGGEVLPVDLRRRGREEGKGRGC